MPPERSIKDRTTIAWDAVDAVMVVFSVRSWILLTNRFTEERNSTISWIVVSNQSDVREMG